MKARHGEEGATGHSIALLSAVVQDVGPLPVLDLRSAERGLIDAPQMADGAAGFVAGGVVNEARRRPQQTKRDRHYCLSLHDLRSH
jgi:hypothetical protein